MFVEIEKYFRKILLMSAACKVEIEDVGIHTSFDELDRFRFYLTVMVNGHSLICSFRPEMSEIECRKSFMNAKHYLMGSKPVLKKPTSSNFLKIMPYITRYFNKVERMNITINSKKNTIDVNFQEFTKYYGRWHYLTMEANESDHKIKDDLANFVKILKPIKSYEGRNR